METGRLNSQKMDAYDRAMTQASGADDAAAAMAARSAATIAGEQIRIHEATLRATAGAQRHALGRDAAEVMHRSAIQVWRRRLHAALDRSRALLGHE